MSEAKAPRIDPRFDPRFQRGYVPDAAGPVDPGGAASPAEPVEATPSGPSANSGTEVFAEPAEAAVQGLSTSSGTEVFAGPAEAAVQGPSTSSGTEVFAEPVEATVPGPSTSSGTDVFAALVEPDEDEPPTLAAWFLAGWGVAVVATVVGVALWWASIVSQDFYSGPSNESDRWLQAFGWMVAPSLIEAGLLGLVVMLVWTGLRHVRRHGEPT